MFKQEEHGSNEMTDFQSIEKQFTEEISDALSQRSATSPRFGSTPTKESEKKNYKMADEKTKFNDSSDDIFKHPLSSSANEGSYHKMSESYISFESPRKMSSEDSIISILSSDEFPSRRFNDLSSIEMGDVHGGIPAPSSSETEEKESTNASKQSKQKVSNNKEAPRATKNTEISKQALNTTTTSTKTNNTSSYSIWCNMTKNLTGQKRHR